MTLRLSVQTAEGARTEYPLEGKELVVGRATTAGIVIPDSRVSRQHARFVLRDGGWWVEDLGARNRTLLNGVPVERPAMLHAGDRIEVGDAVLRLLDDGPAAPATAPVAVPDARTSTGVDPANADSARMSTINKIHRALADSLSLAELLDLILARCFDVLQPEEGLIMLRGRDGILATAASRRRDAGAAPVVVPRRLVDEVMGKGKPALVLDAAYDDRFTGSVSMVTSGIRSVVAAPIVDAEGTLGLITLTSRIAVRQFAQPDLDMLVSIASAAALRVRNVALADELAARLVVEHELAVAHDVQMDMLPRRMPSHPGLAVAAQLKPAHSVGGDLYDVALDGDRLWFIVADVAGKSIAAALYMAIARTLFRATVRGATDVADVAARMNQELARDNERLMFVTAAIGCLDLRDGSVTLIDAGHNPVLLAGSDGVQEVSGVPKGPALGVMEGIPYAGGGFVLDPATTLVLYTDGVTDARATSGEMFGDLRLRQTIATGAMAPEQLVATLMDAVDRFGAGAPPDDDITVLALRYARP